MRHLLLRWVVLAVAMAVTAKLFDGIEIIGGPAAYIIVSAVFGLVNAVVGSIVRLVSLPLTIITLGLSLLIVNAVLLLITAGLTDSLRIDGFGSAVIGGLCISLLSMLLNRVVRLVT